MFSKSDGAITLQIAFIEFNKTWQLGLLSGSCDQAFEMAEVHSSYCSLLSPSTLKGNVGLIPLAAAFTNTEFGGNSPSNR